MARLPDGGALFVGIHGERGAGRRAFGSGGASQEIEHLMIITDASRPWLLMGFAGFGHDWTLFVVGLLVGIPAFFGVGLVLLVPILFTTVKQTNRPLLTLALPMLAALSAMHGLVPPHPGPIAVIDELHADLGKTLLLSLLIGIPTAVIAGPLLAPIMARRTPVTLSGGIAAQLTGESAPSPPPVG